MRLPLSFLPSFYSQVQTATNRNSSYSSIFWETVRNVSFSTIPCLTNSLILNNFEFCTERRREMREERRGEGKIGFKASNKSGGSEYSIHCIPHHSVLSHSPSSPHLHYLEHWPHSFFSLLLSITLIREIFADPSPTLKQLVEERRCETGSQEVLLHS